jgi:amino acid transporter
VGAIVVLTVVNILGVREGKWTQNFLTAVKVAGLAAICVVGLLLAPAGASPAADGGRGPADFRQAMILILYAYGGWNEMAYVAAEVRDPRRNILRSLVLGTVAVTLIYVLGNAAFIHALGFEGMAGSKAVAADVLRRGAGDWAGRAISLLICISTLGAINGMIFTGARITYAMGAEHRVYAWLGRWNARRGTPVWSLVIQAAVTLALVVGFGRTRGGFQSLVNFTTPVFWVFFVLVGVSLFALRWREADWPRPYRVPGYPMVPILFCLSSLFMVWASLSWAVEHRSGEAVWAVGILAVGLALSMHEAKPAQRIL